MRYQVHQLKVKEETARETLQAFLNQLQGEIVTIVPYVRPIFMPFGATSRTDFLLIVEKIRK